MLQLFVSFNVVVAVWPGRKVTSSHVQSTDIIGKSIVSIIRSESGKNIYNGTEIALRIRSWFICTRCKAKPTDLKRVVCRSWGKLAILIPAASVKAPPKPINFWNFFPWSIVIFIFWSSEGSWWNARGFLDPSILSKVCWDVSNLLDDASETIIWASFTGNGSIGS